MACLHWLRPISRPRQRLRPMELGSMIMLESINTEPRPRPMQISIGSVHILSVSVSVSVSVSGSVNEPLDLNTVRIYGLDKKSLLCRV